METETTVETYKYDKAGKMIERKTVRTVEKAKSTKSTKRQ